MTNKELVKNLQYKGVLKTASIIKAFENIDRKDFVLKKYQNEAYEDIPLPIGYGQTISQPYTVAFMLELLNPKTGDKVLDVGSGSGYSSALLAEIVGESGKVEAREIIGDLLKQAKENIKKYPYLNINFSFPQDDTSQEGQIYDRILVSAAADKIPNYLTKQLKTKGKLVIPINNSIYKITKKEDNSIEKQEFYGFSFVALINN